MNVFRWFNVFLIIATTTSPLFAQTAIEAKFISKVSQKRLKQNVHELVKYGNRFGGTRSGNKASRFVYNTLKSYGLKTELVKDPEKLACTNESWHLRIEHPKRLRGLIQHEWLANYSPSSRRDTAHVVFIESIGDIDDEEVDSGAVLLQKSPSEKMYNELTDAGVRCIVCYEASNVTSYSNWAMISSLKVSAQNSIPVFNISNIAGKRMRAEIEKGTRLVIRYSAKTRIKPGNPKTVIASLEGESADYYIICAHGDSDSGGPGADDNASGVSGLLEIARILNTFVQNKTLSRPQWSIRFIVWGSETFSTQNYIRSHSEELERIKGVINIDEIGSGKTRSCLYFEGNDITQNQEMLRIFEKVGEDYVDKLGFWREATTNPAQGGTDSYLFLSESLDELNVPDITIPSITIFTTAWNEPKSMFQTKGWLSKAWKGHPDSVTIDYSPYYHSTLDIPAFTTDKEPSRMAWGVNAVGITLLRILWK